MDVLVGVCGFPRSRRLIYSSLDAVELQETFYDLPSEERMAALRREAPSFHFAVKVFQGITHPPGSPTYRRSRFRPGEGNGYMQPSRENLELWDEFRRRVKPLRPEAYVFQTPPSMRREHLRGVREFLASIERDGVVVWEPRGEVYDEAVRIGEELGVIIAADPFRRVVRPFNGVAYMRLHGRGGGEVNYRYKYTDGDLAELRGIVLRLGADRAYVMFNNVYMFDDAVRFKSLLSEVRSV